ncbi:helix-turn-helix domain-containing protein [Flavobacterium sp.]|uniref:helix-turn-helix domain-containing protein n=1 Tax=Flavobacterium sp. TaxID=239 RepID=UPI003D6A7E53
MKSTTTIKSILGLSQIEMALLLGVSKSQWSMYEIGQRDLPLTAKKKLTALLSHLQNSKGISAEKQNFTALEQIKTQEWLENEKHNLEYKEQLLDRKIRAIEKKRATCFAALETVHFLETQQQDTHNSLIKSIKSRAIATLSNNTLYHLQEMQMKKEHLTMLKNSVAQKMKHISLKYNHQIPRNSITLHK